jgi:hypothetical protein
MPGLLLRIGAMIFAVAMLAGCKTTALEPQDQPLASRNARIYVIRPYAMISMALPASVKVNGSEVGSVANASYLSVDRPPGRYTVEVGSPGYFGSSEVEMQAEAGRSYYFVLRMSATQLPLGTMVIPIESSGPGGRSVGQSKGLPGSSLGELDATQGAAVLARMKRS